MGAGADYHYRNEADFLRILEYARDFDRNDIVVGQGVDRFLDNFLQGGFQLDTETGDEALNQDLWARWQNWAKDPEQVGAAGELNWCSIERLIPREVAVDGDVCALPLASGQLEIMEAHRLRTPTNTKRNVIHGVLLDRNRRRMEYWFTQDDIDPFATVSNVSSMRRVAARDADGNKQVFHCYRPKRMTQTRGLSLFTPIFDAIGMHDDIQFATLLKQQIASCIVFLRERLADPTIPWGAAPQTGEKTTEPLGDGTTRVIEG